MVKLLRNEWFRLILASTTAVVATAVAFLVFSDSASAPGHVMLTTGAYGAGVNPRNWSEALPLTAAEAVTAGWEDPGLCSSGRGRYFQKEGAPYHLLYNHRDDLIGIYHFSENEMPPPWEKLDELKGGGRITILEEHWGIFVYFQDPTRACLGPFTPGQVGNRQ